MTLRDSSAVPRNRHPVDELADIRVEQKRLKEREDELRAIIIGHRCELRGSEFEAEIKTSVSERLDIAAVRKEFGAERLRKFLRPAEVITVRVQKIEVDEPVDDD